MARQSTESEETAVVTRDENAGAIALLPTKQDVQGIIEDLGGEQLNVSLLTRAKLIAGGVTLFDIVDGDKVQALEGVLIIKQPTRVYWTEKFGSNGGVTVPPDCSSLDNVIGTGNRKIDGVDEPEDSQHECARCPLADFGTATNEAGEATNGKACRQVTRIFMLQQTDGQYDVLPVLLTLPPSSYSAALKYAIGLRGKRLPYYEVKTRITLEKTRARNGFDVAVAKFTNLGPLEPDERAAIASYRDELMPFLNSLSIVDVEGTEAASD